LNFKIRDRKLNKRLDDFSETVKAYGKPIAKRIHQRLQEFSSAETLEDLRMLPAAYCHELKDNYAGCLAVDISKNLRIIFKPEEEPPPTKDDGGLDWSAVTDIVIIEITDYH
jgi:toxin HigB-1